MTQMNSESKYIVNVRNDNFEIIFPVHLLTDVTDLPTKMTALESARNIARKERK